MFNLALMVFKIKGLKSNAEKDKFEVRIPF